MSARSHLGPPVPGYVRVEATSGALPRRTSWPWLPAVALVGLWLGPAAIARGEPAAPAGPVPPESAAAAPATAGPDASAGRAAPAPARARERPRYRTPLLELGGHALFGLHDYGDEVCVEVESQCDRTGTFFGLGGSLELRARLWRPLLAHVRVQVSGNTSQQKPAYSGFVAPAVGLGVYGGLAFVRAEYLVFAPFGDPRFELAFAAEGTGTTRWGRHGGALHLGVRLPVAPRTRVELYGGLNIGPQVRRTLPDQEQRELLLGFTLGVGAMWGWDPRDGLTARP